MTHKPGKGNQRHGMCYSREWRIWHAMKQRCLNPKASHYEYYGGRGIKVCERWMSFENFYRDMGLRPSKFHSIGRIDNQGDYSPDNCRWELRKQQMRNTSRNRFVTFNGKTMCVNEWAEQLDTSASKIIYRLNRGHPPEVALSSRPLKELLT